jgi:hypothetical protein
MNDSFAMVDRLRRTAARIAEWQAEADRLRATIGLTGRDEEMLVEIEQTASAIYREIDAFDAIVEDIERQSPAAAGEIAEVGDALRLLLMEITELSIAAYALEPAAHSMPSRPAATNPGHPAPVI